MFFIKTKGLSIAQDVANWCFISISTISWCITCSAEHRRLETTFSRSSWSSGSGCKLCPTYSVHACNFWEAKSQPRASSCSFGKFPSDKQSCEGISAHFLASQYWEAVVVGKDSELQCPHAGICFLILASWSLNQSMAICSWTQLQWLLLHLLPHFRGVSILADWFFTVQHVPQIPPKNLQAIIFFQISFFFFSVFVFVFSHTHTVFYFYKR